MMNPFAELPVALGPHACHLETGYCPEILLSLYERYHSNLFEDFGAATGHHWTATEHHKHFYLMYVYIHKVTAHRGAAPCLQVVKRVEQLVSRVAKGLRGYAGFIWLPGGTSTLRSCSVSSCMRSF